MGQSQLRIGTLARRAGVGVETIRYYQRRGLLGVPPRPLGRARALGFSPDEAAVLLQLNDGTGHGRARRLASSTSAADRFTSPPRSW